MSSSAAAGSRPNTARRGGGATARPVVGRPRLRARRAQNTDVPAPPPQPEPELIREISLTLVFGEKIDQVTLFETQFVGELNCLIQNLFGIPINHQIIFGWPNGEPDSPATELKDLNLPTEALLQVASSAPGQNEVKVEASNNASTSTSTSVSPLSLHSQTATTRNEINIGLEKMETSTDEEDVDEFVINVYVLANAEPHEVNFRPTQTIKEIKNIFADLTGIPPASQVWSGWPEHVRSDDWMLKDANLDKPSHSVRLLEATNEDGGAAAAPVEVAGTSRSAINVDDRKRKLLFDGMISSNVPSYPKMMELMEKQGFISNFEDSECPICYSALPAGDGVILRECLHVFCKECLVGCIEHGEEPSVKCPYSDGENSCESELLATEIRAIAPPEIVEKYLRRSVKLAENQMENSYHCKTPDCSGWCTFEDEVNVFECPVCDKTNCITCAAIHDGQNCKEYQRDLAINAETDVNAKKSLELLRSEIQKGQALHCPKCQVIVMKKWGCDWLVCSFCKTEICWVTKGPRWGKKGHGDISGGCRCRVNGKKCHPKCGNCH